MVIDKFKQNAIKAASIVKDYINSAKEYDSENVAAQPLKLGMYLAVVFVGTFVLWGTFAPINSAVIAPGKVVLDFNRKVVQHLEGGIVEQIFVKEGQFVVTDEPLVSLRDVSVSSQQSLLNNQLMNARAQKIRLEGERDSWSTPDFQSLSEISDNHTVFETQKDIFDSRKKSIQGKIGIFKKQKQQGEDELSGLESQIVAIKKELELAGKEQSMFKKLAAGGNVALTRVIEAEKQIAHLEGTYGELTAEVAKIKKANLAIELEIIDLQNEHLNRVLSELEEVEQAISDLTEQTEAASDILTRTVIRAPVSGTIMDLQVHTVGAVVSPGAEIMYVVPQDDTMIVEAIVNPNDIDQVYSGMPAKVQLTAYRAKKAPKLDATVITVSADILKDELTGEAYYLARVKVAESMLKELQSNIKLYPGMPAQVFMIGDARSLFDYLFTPISDATYKAFREE